MLRKAEITDKVDMCETLLRLGGTQDCDGMCICKYSQTCIKRSPLGQRQWSFKTGDLLKEDPFI